VRKLCVRIVAAHLVRNAVKKLKTAFVPVAAKSQRSVLVGSQPKSSTANMKPTVFTAIQKGFLATIILLFIYFTVVSLVSGWSFAQDQFSKFWYFMVTLALGFGIQVGLYNYLKTSGKVLAISGTTSTAAMISCCAHYLVNFLPILGVVGIITVISQYQVQLFWVGIAFNLAGLAYMLFQVRKFRGRT